MQSVDAIKLYVIFIFQCKLVMQTQNIAVESPPAVFTKLIRDLAARTASRKIEKNWHNYQKAGGTEK